MRGKLSFEIITRVIIGVLLVLLPFWFSPTLSEWYEKGKWLFLVITSLTVLFLWLLKTVKTGKITIAWSGVGFGSICFVLASFVSLIVSSVNKMESVVAPFGIETWMSIALLFLLVPTMLKEKDKGVIRFFLLLLSGCMGLLVIYQQLGTMKYLFPDSTALHDPLWSPMGQPMALLALFLLSVPLVISFFRHSKRMQNDGMLVLAVIVGGLITVGFGITLWRFSPYIQTLLPLSTGVTILFSAFSSLKAGFFGIGAENFLFTFTLYRPQGLNMTPLWNIGFTANASLFLQMVTIYGILGLTASIIFLKGIFPKKPYSITSIEAVLIIFLFLFFPPSVALLSLCVVVLLTSVSFKEMTEIVGVPSRIVVVIIPFLIGIVACWGVWRFFDGEVLFTQSLAAAKDGNGTNTHTLQVSAIRSNPLRPTYHIALSQTYIGLIEGMIANAPKKDDGTILLLPEDKTMIADFIANAIKEGKLGITLAPDSVVSWVTLAGTYQELVGIAKDADAWAIAAYQKAITLDPTNPIIRTNFCILYRKLGRLDEAHAECLTGLTLKPNYLPALHNLAYIFKEKGDYDNAIKTLEQTKALIAKGSSDESVIEGEIVKFLEEKKAGK